MKLKIKIKLIDKGSYAAPLVTPNGEWIDLRARMATTLQRPSVNGNNVIFSSELIPLGIAAKLPKGFEANIVARSSLFKSKSLIVANSFGVIDNAYCGNEDEWKLPAIALNTSYINRGERLAQFRIVPSQKAGFLAKLKWLLSTGVKLVFVDDLEDKNRGGFGSTGTK